MKTVMTESIGRRCGSVFGQFNAIGFFWLFLAKEVRLLLADLKISSQWELMTLLPFKSGKTVKLAENGLTEQGLFPMELCLLLLERKRNTDVESL